jgi:hypothetical protein
MKNYEITIRYRGYITVKVKANSQLKAEYLALDKASRKAKIEGADWAR